MLLVFGPIPIRIVSNLIHQNKVIEWYVSQRFQFNPIRIVSKLTHQNKANEWYGYKFFTTTIVIPLLPAP